MTDERCREIVYRPGEMQGHLCTKPHWKDGYCKVHHPDRVEARLAARNAKWDAEWDAKWAAEAKRERIERAERKVLAKVEAWADSGMALAKQPDVLMAVDELREARK